MAKLHELIESQQWDAVERCAKSRPHEICSVSDQGLSSLHLACRSNMPSSTIRTLLIEDAKVEHQAVLMTDWFGRTPLMYICDCTGGRLDLIRDFVEIAPVSAKAKEVGGWTPLHFMCANWGGHSSVSLDVAKLLISADKSMVRSEDVYGQTPLMILAFRFQKVTDELSESEGINWDDGSFHFPIHEGGAETELVHKAKSCWQLACTIIASEFDESSTAPMLHQYCSFPNCPSVFLNIALNVYSSHFQMTDSNGNTPLHIAAQQDDANLIVRLLSRDVSLLRRRNNSGELPLQISGRKSWSESHSVLMHYFPGALEASDFPDTYYPRVFGNSKARPQTVFCLLQAKPDLVRACR